MTLCGLKLLYLEWSAGAKSARNILEIRYGGVASKLFLLSLGSADFE